MPDFKPFIVIGLALGGVYAMSGVGLVVLFRTTGVLNLAYGAVGALGSLVAFTLIDHEQNEWMAYGVAIVLAGVLTLIYGLLLGPPLANRDPLVKASASLGFALILLGFMQWRWTADVRSLSLPTSEWQYTGAGRLAAHQLDAGDRHDLPGRRHDRHDRVPQEEQDAERRCGRSPTIVTTPPSSVYRCAASRRRPGSSPVCCSGSRG